MQDELALIKSDHWRLMEHALCIAGKDARRIREILLRGTLVAGASRFRWVGWDAPLDELLEALATFPDPDPARPFAAADCVRAALRGGRRSIECDRESAGGSRLFRNVALWDALMELAAAGSYAGYSYRERADRYARELSAADAAAIRAAAATLPRGALKDQILLAPFTVLEALTVRNPA